MPNSIVLSLIVLGLLVASWWLLPGPWAKALIGLRRWRGGLRSRWLKSGDIRWHYLAGGNGKDTLVLLHGFGADADHWVEISRSLGEHFRLIAPDTPGFGDTEAPDGYDFAIQQQTEALIELLDQMGIERCHLAGNSMGGYLAADLAARHPERVASLWLLAPFGMRSAEESATDRAIRTGENSPFQISDLAEFKRDVLGHMFGRSFYLPYPLLHHYGKQALGRLELGRRAFKRITEASTPLEQIAPDITQPTLIQWGESDQVTHISGAEPLANAIDNVNLVIQMGAGHLPMLELPGITADIYLNFQQSG